MKTKTHPVLISFSWLLWVPNVIFEKALLDKPKIGLVRPKTISPFSQPPNPGHFKNAPGKPGTSSSTRERERVAFQMLRRSRVFKMPWLCTFFLSFFVHLSFLSCEVSEVHLGPKKKRVKREREREQVARQRRSWMIPSPRCGGRLSLSGHWTTAPPTPRAPESTSRHQAMLFQEFKGRHRALGGLKKIQKRSMFSGELP